MDSAMAQGGLFLAIAKISFFTPPGAENPIQVL